MINIIVVSFLALVALSWLSIAWQVILPFAIVIFIASKVWPGDRRFVQQSRIERAFYRGLENALSFVLYSFYTWIPAAGVGMLLGGTKQEQAQIGLVAIILINIWLIRYMNRKP